MAIKISDEYPYAEAPSADYPGGSFKNDSTGATGDGTPVDNKWANDMLGFFQALLANAGIVPSGAPDTAQASQYLQALQSLMWTPTDTKFVFRTTPGVGWLEINGGTVGDASSGASERANADTVALFTYLWALSPLQLYTSAGAVVARGASAAADFAAHRKIALPDMRGVGPRGWDHGRGLDPGRVLGSYQADAIQNITGTIAVDDMTLAGVSGVFVQGDPYPYDADSHYSGGGAKVNFDASRVVRTTADDTRGKNVSGMWIIKY